MTTDSNLARSQWRAKALIFLYWMLVAVAIGIFVISAAMKFSGRVVAINTFGRIGIDHKFRYLLGGLELLGAAMLLNRKTWWGGWSVLVAETVVAVLIRVLVIHSDISYTMQLLAILMLLAYLPRPEQLHAALAKMDASLSALVENEKNDFNADLHGN